MKEKKIRRVWSVSMLISGVCIVMLGLTGMTGLPFRDALMWFFGTVGLTAPAALIYASARSVRGRRDPGGQP